MRVIALTLAILFCNSVEAKPWYKDPKVWLLAGIQAGTASWQIKASHDCRPRAGIGSCFGGYGERKAMVGFVIGLNAAGFGMSMWWRSEDLPEWSIPGLAATGFNVIDAARNQHARCETTVIGGQCQDDAKASGMRYQVKP